jgi:hypothetical protein
MTLTSTEAGYGRIVNVASIAGKEGNPNAAAYSALPQRSRLQARLSTARPTISSAAEGRDPSYRMNLCAASMNAVHGMQANMNS